MEVIVIKKRCRAIVDSGNYDSLTELVCARSHPEPQITASLPNPAGENSPSQND